MGTAVYAMKFFSCHVNRISGTFVSLAASITSGQLA
jgi:hypothetical protein